jgi:hypothetical protein
MHCLLQGLCRHFRVATICWGPKQVFTYDSDLHQGAGTHVCFLLKQIPWKKSEMYYNMVKYALKKRNMHEKSKYALFH